MKWHLLNAFPPGQNGRHFPDDISKCIFMNEEFRILVQMSLNLVPVGPINNKSALILVMAWPQRGTNPLGEPILTQFIDAYMRPSWKIS